MFKDEREISKISLRYTAYEDLLIEMGEKRNDKKHFETCLKNRRNRKKKRKP